MLFLEERHTCANFLLGKMVKMLIELRIMEMQIIKILLPVVTAKVKIIMIEQKNKKCVDLICL